MIRFSEPNTKEFEQRVLVDSAFEEHVEGDQHYVHVVNPERVRGFPVEINLEEGENNPEGLHDGENEKMFWMKLKLEVGMCPQHHLSLIRDPTENRQGRGLGKVLRRNWCQVHLIRRARMIRKEKIRMIQVDEIFLS